MDICTQRIARLILPHDGEGVFDELLDEKFKINAIVQVMLKAFQKA